MTDSARRGPRAAVKPDAGTPSFPIHQRDAPADAAKGALLSHALWMEALGGRPV